MREVEIKAKVKDFEQLKAILKKEGCVFTDPIVQKDTVYVERVGTMEDFLSNSYFPRIRETEGKTIFTFKKQRAQDKGNNLDKIEYEVLVSNKDIFEKILAEFGLQRAVYTEKTRQKTHWGEYEICLDEISLLGSFIEIEKDAPDTMLYEDIHRELTDILFKWGIEKKDFITKGYDILTLENELQQQ